MAKLKFGPVEGGIQLGAGENGGDVNNPDSGNLGGRGGTEDNGVTDPATVTASGTGSGGKERKKRGPNKGKAENKQMDVATLKNSLVFMHIIAAGVFGSPELALNTEQADLYASAVADVMKHYDTSVPAKTLAWMNLAAAAGGIYYQKVVEIGSRPPATVTRSQMGA
jgi:hypothetical protein